MPEDVRPAKLRYATDSKPEPASPPAETKPAVPEEKQLTEKQQAKSPPATGSREAKAPELCHKIPSRAITKKGWDLMGKKKVTLKVEDLLKAGRSHFEIPKSHQEKIKKQPPRRRG